MYKNKLKERERRKQVAKDFGLVETFFKENPLNPSTGKISAPKPKKKDPKSEVFKKFKVVSSIVHKCPHIRRTSSFLTNCPPNHTF